MLVACNCAALSLGPFPSIVAVVRDSHCSMTFGFVPTVLHWETDMRKNPARGVLFAIAFALLNILAVQLSFAESGKGEYVLGPGDIIRISVFQNPDLTVETRVAESGSISFPLIGAVQVGGLPVAAAEQKIAKQLRDGKFVLQPQVNVLVLEVRGSQVAVLGHVKNPGRYPLELANMKVSDAIALAGGVLATGSDSIVVLGTREGKPFRKETDLPALFQSGKGSENTTITGGDIVYVHRASQYYIYGEVQRPGAYRLERDMTVMQAVAQGGGVTPRGTEKGLKIHRRDAGGKVQALEPKMEDRVLADDVIYLRESLF